MEYEQLLKILRIINSDNNLNEGNVIEKIKDKLKEKDPDTHQEWEDKKFNINHTFNNECKLLHIAVRGSLKKVAELLIKKNADVNAEDKSGWTPLHWAVQNAHIETVKALLKKGAKVDAVDEYGNTPLLKAAMNGHIEIVKALIEKGAKVDAVDEYGNTPLLWAAGSGSIEIVKVLRTCSQSF